MPDLSSLLTRVRWWWHWRCYWFGCRGEVAYADGHWFSNCRRCGQRLALIKDWRTDAA